MSIKTRPPNAQLVQAWVEPDLKKYIKRRAAKSRRTEAGELRYILDQVRAAESKTAPAQPAA